MQCISQVPKYDFPPRRAALLLRSMSQRKDSLVSMLLKSCSNRSCLILGSYSAAASAVALACVLKEQSLVLRPHGIQTTAPDASSPKRLGTSLMRVLNSLQV